MVYAPTWGWLRDPQIGTRQQKSIHLVRERACHRVRLGPHQGRKWRLPWEIHHLAFQGGWWEPRLRIKECGYLKIRSSRRYNKTLLSSGKCKLPNLAQHITSGSLRRSIWWILSGAGWIRKFVAKSFYFYFSLMIKSRGSLLSIGAKVSLTLSWSNVTTALSTQWH